MELNRYERVAKALDAAEARGRVEERGAWKAKVEALAAALESLARNRMTKAKEPGALTAKQLRSSALARLADAKLLRALVADADHPDYRQEWKP